MDGTTSSQTRPDADPAPLRAVPLDIGHIVVPLDGSPFSERALPVAAWVASGLAADIHLVEVVSSEEEAEGAIRYLDSVSHRHRAGSWDVIEQKEVAEGLAEVLAVSPGRMACLATHGRDRSATLLGSVAASLLDLCDRPVMLVGPEARAITSGDAPVVVAVDGTDRDDSLVATGLSWAAGLRRRLEIVTVAEPVPPGYREDVPPQRARGPAKPEEYLAGLVDRVDAPDLTVTTHVCYDPVSVRDGLVPLLDRAAALVVLGSRHRTVVPRMVLGSHAARIVHDAAVPALVVPSLPAD